MGGDFKNSENKAGWNASQEIIQTLSNLRNSFISAMMEDNLKQGLNVCRRILDVISGKVDEYGRNNLNRDIYLIETSLPRAENTYVYNASMLYSDIKFRTLIKRCIEDLYRRLESLQDQKGYGMKAADDPNRAVEFNR